MLMIRAARHFSRKMNLLMVMINSVRNLVNMNQHRKISVKQRAGAQAKAYQFYQNHSQQVQLPVAAHQPARVLQKIRVH